MEVSSDVKLNFNASLDLANASWGGCQTATEPTACCFYMTCSVQRHIWFPNPFCAPLLMILACGLLGTTTYDLLVTSCGTEPLPNPVCAPLAKAVDFTLIEASSLNYRNVFIRWWKFNIALKLVL